MTARRPEENVTEVRRFSAGFRYPAAVVAEPIRNRADGERRNGFACHGADNAAAVLPAASSPAFFLWTIEFGVFMSSDKSGLRRHFARLRESMTPGERREADAAIRDRLSQWSVFADAPAVAAFAAFGAEPELSALADGKAWFLPRRSPSACIV